VIPVVYRKRSFIQDCCESCNLFHIWFENFLYTFIKKIRPERVDSLVRPVLISNFKAKKLSLYYPRRHQVVLRAD
jgi:hypothetical protein